MQARENVLKLPPLMHGGKKYTPLPGEDILDFSVNCNPYGAPPGIKGVIKNTTIDDYPDTESTQLRKALAYKFGLEIGNILAGNGSTEIIRLIASAYIDSGDKVFILQPTYSDYEIACRIMNAEIRFLPASAETNFYFNTDTIISQIQHEHPRAVFICNPNNPTGQYLGQDDIARLLQANPQALLILDEAYIAFTTHAWAPYKLLHAGNLIVIRSMTKDYALAGIRIGYAISSGQIISALNKVKPPWNVSSLAQSCGLSALQHDEYVRNCGRKIQKAKKYLTG
ncbi:MAG TPA: histidinol-phosphate transaminase, partial [Dehalococcoidia bacterium]|nr:histidinol-phosphate transaminase [Dehalococcoidia bacterium]